MFPEILTVTIEEVPEGQVLHLDGQLDPSTIPQLEDGLAKCQASEVVLDLRRLVFIDSAGVRALLRARDEALAAGRRMRVVGAHGQVRQVFDLAGLGEAFP